MESQVLWDRKAFPALPAQEVPEEIRDRSVLRETLAQEVMPVQEATQGRRVFRVSRVFVAISVRKAIPDVKGLRETSALRVRRDRPVRSGRPDRREISGHRDPEVFRVQPVQPDPPAPWALRVSQGLRVFRV